MKARFRTTEEINRRNAKARLLPQDIQGLREALHNQDEEIRELVVLQMAKLNNSDVIQPLIEALKDDNESVRSSAVLGLEHYRANEAVPSLINLLLNDASGQVRAMCASALSGIGGNEAMDALANALEDTDEYVRYLACWAFAQNEDSRAKDDILKLLDDPVWDIRKAACEVLIELRVADCRIEKTIYGLMRDPEAEDYENRLAAMNEFIQAEGYDTGSVSYSDNYDGMVKRIEILEEPLDKLAMRAHKLMRKSCKSCT